MQKSGVNIRNRVLMIECCADMESMMKLDKNSKVFYCFDILRFFGFSGMSSNKNTHLQKSTEEGDRRVAW